MKNTSVLQCVSVRMLQVTGACVEEGERVDEGLASGARGLITNLNDQFNETSFVPQRVTGYSTDYKIMLNWPCKSS